MIISQLQGLKRVDVIKNVIIIDWETGFYLSFVFLVSPYSPEIEEKAKKEIDDLLEEFKKFDLSEYIVFYDKKTHAYYRYDYSIERYVKPEVQKYCKDWCFRFNYAHQAIKKILEVKKASELS